MVRRRVRQYQAEKLAQGKRIGRPPRDRAFGIEAFEAPDQQQAEVATGRQTRPAAVRVKPPAQAFDVPVKALFVEDLIQSRVERMRRTPRQVVGGHPHRRLLRVPPSFAHRHWPQWSTWDRTRRSLIQGFTTGC